MAKEIEGYLKLQIRGGQANPSPPVGPALGSKGLNIMDFCKGFNARTQEKQGQLLPVLITIFKDKSFDFVIKTPPAAVLLMEKAKIKKGSSEPNRAKVATVTWDVIKEIAEIKMPDLNASDLTADDSLSLGNADEMDTMMDLAKAYIDMGDNDSASSALGEIVKSGNPEQRTEAETLLRKIS